MTALACLRRSFVSTSLATSLCLALAAPHAAAQIMGTDAPDYPPGETAILMAMGFQPGEVVQVQVVHADGTPDLGDDHQPWLMSADSNGDVVTTWHVCEDDCVGKTLLAKIDGLASGVHTETLFTDGAPVHGTVSLSAVGGSCLDYSAAQGGGPDNWEVVEGGTYQMTISAVPPEECAGNAITVFVQNGHTGNFCFTATGGNGTYVGQFTMPNPACFTSPISYKCGADQPCDNSDTFNAMGPSGSRSVHLRASTFDSNCVRIATDEDCSGCTCNGVPVLSTETVCNSGVTINLGCNPSSIPGCDPSVTASDNCGPVPVVCNFHEGVLGGCLHARRVVYNASNDCGISGKCDTLYSWRVDNTAPTIENVPAGAELGCNPNSVPGVDPNVTVSDNCFAPSHLHSSVSDSAEGCRHTRTITYTANDGCGNQADPQQTIYTWTADVTAPEFDDAPGDSDLGCNPAAIPGASAVTASDDCGPAFVSSQVSDTSTGCDHLRTITYTAIDGCSNVAVHVQHIAWIEDNDPPSIDGVGPDGTVECPNEPVFSQPTASDACGDATLEQSDEFELATDCQAQGFVSRRTRTWIATDHCGNTSSLSQTITQVDTTPPTIDSCAPDMVVNGGGNCCVSVNGLGQPTAHDTCSGVDLSSSANGACFPVGTNTVVWTVTDACGNSSTCDQTVEVYGQICATKFYDANLNGVRDGNPLEAGVAGWKVTVDDGRQQWVGYTSAQGTVCFDVPAGAYTVSEGTPLSPSSWVATSATSQPVTIDASHCSGSVAFGNFCFRGPANGFTLGFWSNKNGMMAIQTNNASYPYPHANNWRSLLNGLNLRNANGTPYTVPYSGSTTTQLTNDYNNFRNWLLNGNATNMAYMLSVQLAATTLDVALKGLSDSTALVVPGGVKTGANVCIVPFLSVAQPINCGAPPLLSLTSLPGSTACGCSSNDGLVTISALRAAATCLLGSYGNTTVASTQRTYQECVKNLLDMINNNGNNGYACGGLTMYVNPGASACPFTF